MTKQTHALTVLATPALRAPRDALAALQAAALAQLAAVGELEQKTAVGGIVCGLTLLRVKASMPHGTFSEWLRSMASKTNGVRFCPRQAQFLMRLALSFLETTRAQVPDLLALPGDQLHLDIADTAAGKSLAAKLQKFVGARSLYALLVAHGIRTVSRGPDADKGAGPDADKGAGPDDDEGHTERTVRRALTVQDRYEEIDRHLRLAADSASDPVVWLALSRQQHDELRDAAAATAARFADLHHKTHGRAAR